MGASKETSSVKVPRRVTTKIWPMLLPFVLGLSPFSPDLKGGEVGRALELLLRRPTMVFFAGELGRGPKVTTVEKTRDLLSKLACPFQWEGRGRT